MLFNWVGLLSEFLILELSCLQFKPLLRLFGTTVNEAIAELYMMANVWGVKVSTCDTLFSTISWDTGPSYSNESPDLITTSSLSTSTTVNSSDYPSFWSFDVSLFFNGLLTFVTLEKQLKNKLSRSLRTAKEVSWSREGVVILNMLLQNDDDLDPPTF